MKRYHIIFDGTGNFIYIIQKRRGNQWAEWVDIGREESSEDAEKWLYKYIKREQQAKDFPRYYDEEGNCLS